MTGQGRAARVSGCELSSHTNCGRFRNSFAMPSLRHFPRIFSYPRSALSPLESRIAISGGAYEISPFSSIFRSSRWSDGRDTFMSEAQFETRIEGLVEIMKQNKEAKANG